MSTNTTDLNELLDHARAAAAAGDLQRARAGFRRAAELAPDCVEAWLGLSSTAAVLSERRAHLARALAIDPQHAGALAGLAEIEALLAEGRLVAPAPARRAIAPAQGPAEQPPSLSAVVAHPPALSRTGGLALIVAATLCLLTMGTLTMVGALIFTSLLGYFLAFIVGPLVGELMLRLVDQLAHIPRGRVAQIALGAAVALGGLAALALGGTLLPAVGLPLTADALAMARSMGAESAAAALLFHPAMVVFVGAATAGTVYRLKK